MSEDRFYVVPRVVQGQPGHALIRGIPDPAKPEDPKKDSRTGETMLEGGRQEFWRLAKDAGYRWVERSFKRYWIHAPHRPLDTGA